jgi:hypothetical protein
MTLRSPSCVAASVVLVMLLGGERLRAQTKAEGASIVCCFGYSGCIELKNENTSVVLCPQSGGRILEYSWKGRNSLYLDPAQKGWHYEPGKSTVDPCGGRFDVGPEKIVPRHPKLWLGRWSGEITGPRRARLTSVKDEVTGVQLVREFKLDADSSRLTCTQIITNISDKAVSWCHWSRTLAEGGGICLIPLTENSRFPNRYVRYGPGPVMNFLPVDPNVRVQNGFLEILGTPQEPKLGMDSYAGWLCYLLKSDLMFVKRFPTYPDRVYNEIAAITVCVWYFKDRMCELEPIGPRERLLPGASASFTEDWWLLPHAFPGKTAEVNLDEISRMVERHAR